MVSFGSGEMEKRYGMIYVDKNNDGKGTLKRLKKRFILNGTKIYRIKWSRHLMIRYKGFH